MRPPKLFWWLLAAAPLAFPQPAPQPLNLHEAERIALKNNPRVGAAALGAAAAEQRPAEMLSSYFPQVTGNLTGVGASEASRIAAGGLNNPVIYDRMASGFTVSQMITDFGRTGNLVASARLQAAAQKQSAEGVRASAVLEADRAYFGLLRAENVLRVARETVKERQLVADQAAALAASKLKSTLDASFANVNLSEAKLLLASAENEVKAASAILSAALGYRDQRSFALAEEPMPGPLADSVDKFIDEAGRSRPELAGLRLTESAEQRAAKAEGQLWLPAVSVMGTAGYIPGRATDLLLHNHWAAAGINVNIPIFNGGLFRARRTEAELRAQAAAKDLQDMQNRVASDVRVAYLNAATAWQRVALTAQMLDQARLALDLAETRYKIGLSSMVELSQAQLSATSAEIANVGARYDYQTQRAVLDYEAGINR